jgi:hypothetical protein
MRCAAPSNSRPAKVRKGSHLSALVRHYRIHNSPRSVQELNFFRGMPSLALAIHHAALAIDSRGKRFDHQRRIALAPLRRAKAILEQVSARLKACASFHTLHSLLLELLGNVRGLGELYFYDTALRLGATFGHAPAFIYLHRGTRAGAQALGFNGTAPYIELYRLPKPLRTLQSHEAEDFLCIYKGELKS